METSDEIDQQRDLFALMGMTLIHIQFTESIINHTLLLVIQDGDSLDLEAWEKQIRFLDRKTLGHMINILKKRAGLHEGLEELLAAFLRDRNTLAHDLDRVDGYELHTKQGRAAMNAFLRELFDNATRLQKIFCDIGVSWQEQVGFVTPFDQDVRDFIGEDNLRISDLLFHEKEAK